MKIGDLFVELGVKGGDAAVNSVGALNTGVKEVASSGLAAKAAIVGMVYSLEQLVQSSNATGTSLTNFETLTGISAQTLQQYQYAARRVGVANEEVTGSFKGLQNAMTSMQLNGSAPKFQGLVAAYAGGIDYNKVNDATYMMQKLQTAMQNAPAAIARQMAQGYGLSEGMVVAMRKNVFTQDNFNKAPAYNEKELNSLARSNVAWADLAVHIEMAIGHLNAQHGGKMIADITKLADSVLRLANSLVHFSDSIKLFEKLGMALEGWTMIFDFLSGTDMQKKYGMEVDADTAKSNKKFFSNWANPNIGDDDGSPIYPTAPKLHNTTVANNTTTNIHSTAYGVHDAHAVGDHIAKATTKSMQRTAQQQSKRVN